MSGQGSTVHVGIDCTSWENERGFGRFTRNLVAALAMRDTGFRYTLLFESAPGFPVPDGVETVIAATSIAMSDASSGTSARRGGDMLATAMAARRIGADLFFYPAVYSYYPFPGLTPTIVCFHDTIPERFPDLIFPSKANEIAWRLKCLVAKMQATRVMTVSETSAGDLARYLRIGRDRIDTVTEGAEPVFRPIGDEARLAARRAAHGIAPEAPLLVYVGGFNRHKNVARLIEAMPAILDAVPGTRLAIVGRIAGARFWDNVDELQASARSDARLAEAVTFTGEIDDAALAELLNAATALVFPSLWEGFGLPAVEAMSCGTPVLSSDRGSLPEVLGDAGVFFDPADASDLAAKTVALLSDPARLERTRQLSLARAREFSWEAGAALAEVSFRKALGRR